MAKLYHEVKPVFLMCALEMRYTFSMNIRRFEQSGLIIANAAGKTLAVDIAAYTPLEKLEGVLVDAMLVSHIHGDHFSIEHIKTLSPKKVYVGSECKEALGEGPFPFDVIEVKAGESIDIEGTRVTPFEVDHGPNASQKPRENFGFLFENDGDSIYFAGDMFYPSGIDVSELEVATALLPVGGFYTFGPAEAVAFAISFKKIGKVLPMHYHKNPETKAEFIAHAAEAGVVLGE